MKLQKLLYYSQAWHLAITGEPMFEEECRAYAKGPVVAEVWHDRKDPSTRSGGQVTDIQVDDTASAIVDLVLTTYGLLEGDELSVLSHDEMPWQVTRGDLPPTAQSNKPIPRGLMASYYRDHKRLGGRTAADLAAVGLIVSHTDEDLEPFDADAFFANLGPEYLEAGIHPVIGTSSETIDNLDFDGIELTRKRAVVESI